MADKATITADQRKALTAIANDAMTLGEAESALNERDFNQRVDMYSKASTAMWTAVRLFGGKDADTAGAESIGIVKAALKADGKTWEPTDPQLSRFRTMRHHTATRRDNYKVWTMGEEKAPTLGEYVSFLGRIARKDANEDGSLTSQGEKKANKQTREKNAKARAVLVDTKVFDIGTFFGATATKAEKAAEIMALQHTLARELSALKLNAADKKAAKSKLADKIDAARKTKKS